MSGPAMFSGLTGHPSLSLRSIALDPWFALMLSAGPLIYLVSAAQSMVWPHTQASQETARLFLPHSRQSRLLSSSLANNSSCDRSSVRGISCEAYSLTSF